MAAKGKAPKQRAPSAPQKLAQKSGKSPGAGRPPGQALSSLRPIGWAAALGVAFLAIFAGLRAAKKPGRAGSGGSGGLSGGEGVFGASVGGPEGVWLRMLRPGDQHVHTFVETRYLTRGKFDELVAHSGSRLFDPFTGERLRTWQDVAELAELVPNSTTPAQGAVSSGAVSSGGAGSAGSGEEQPSVDVLLDARNRYRPGLDVAYVMDGDGGVPFIWPPVNVGHKVTLTDIDPPRGADNPVILETLKESPKVFYVHNFLSDEEAESLIDFAQSPSNPYALRPSTTGHKSWNQGGEKALNQKRTSLNAFDVQSPTSLAIKKRCFELARIEEFNVDMSDGIQVLRYEPSQAYIPHTDYFEVNTSPDHNWDPRDAGTNRFATVFLYLSDVEAGGETVFPKVDAPPEQLAGRNKTEAEQRAAEVVSSGSWESSMARECRERFSVAPKKGDALLFYSQQPDGALDPLSFHGGCPVLGGTKWAANVWIWNGCRYSVCKNLPKKPK